MSQPYTRVVLLNAAAATATGTSQPFDASGKSALTFYIKTNGNPDPGGIVLLEEADWDPNGSQTTLTWSQIASIDVDVTVGTNSQYVYHCPPGVAYGFVRARISVAVVTATIDVVLRAANG